MEEKTYFYLYETKNLLNGMIYVGVHKTSDLNDGYLGSGLRLNNAINKYGEEIFQKTILEFFQNSEDMFSKEKEIVNDEFLKRKDVYNLAIGGHGGFRGEESRRKQSEKMKGRKASEETKEKLSICRKGKALSEHHRASLKVGANKRSVKIKNGEIKSSITDKIKIHKELTIKYIDIIELQIFIDDGWKVGLPESLKYKCGHHISKEQIEKQQEKMKLLYDNGWSSNKGREFSLEWRENMSKAHKGIKQSKESIQKRVIKMTGQKRSEETKLKMSQSKLGKKWKEKLYTYNNGESEKRIPESMIKEFENKGWIKGRSNKLKRSLKNKKGTKCYVNKDGKNKVINKTDLNEYLKNGFSLGKNR